MVGAEERGIRRRKKYVIKKVESKIHPGNTVSSFYENGLIPGLGILMGITFPHTLALASKMQSVSIKMDTALILYRKGQPIKISETVAESNVTVRQNRFQSESDRQVF